MEPIRRRTPLPPLDEGRLNELALRYVGRFATTRAKLSHYLARTLRERGWAGPREPDLGALANLFAERGYVDDRSYALAKSQAMTGRGYGKRRLLESLKAAGIEEEHGAAARAHADAEAVSAALRFARRKRIGPFAASAPRDPRERDKMLAAMVRAGHSFGLSRAILALAPGTEANIEQLKELSPSSDD